MNAPVSVNCDISQCFCETPLDELRVWAVRKYQMGQTTQALMAQARTDHDREMIAIVALFDVPEKELLQLLEPLGVPEHHILHCREHFKDLLELNLEPKH